MSEQFTILTVCTGNICRSPLAQQLIAKALSDIPEINVASVGTQAMVGSGMPEHSLTLAHRYGVVHPESHISRQMTESELQSGDLILAMDRNHARLIAETNPRVATKIFTIREFARLADATTDADLAMEFQAVKPSTTVERLRTGVVSVGLGRGMTPPLADPTQDDVVDPYGHGLDIYEHSANELVPAVTSTVQVLRRALTLEF